MSEELLETSEESIQSRAVLEGLLYITGDEGITLEQAAKALDISCEKAELLLVDLQKVYAADGHGVELAHYGCAYKFVSKAFVHPYAAKLFTLDKPSKLSPAALEILAIVAYKQPITRVEIEEIRGVGADVMLKKLMARGLIKEEGRSDAPGRPILYVVTEAFMDAFGISTLDELPQLPTFEEENSDLFQSQA